MAVTWPSSMSALGDGDDAATEADPAVPQARRWSPGQGGWWACRAATHRVTPCPCKCHTFCIREPSRRWRLFIKVQAVQVSFNALLPGPSVEGFNFRLHVSRSVRPLPGTSCQRRVLARPALAAMNTVAQPAGSLRYRRHAGSVAAAAVVIRFSRPARIFSKEYCLPLRPIRPMRWLSF
jgi:hypothetical protein